MACCVVLSGYFVMHFRFGSHLFVTIKYLYRRGNVCYWQRKPPKALADRFPAGTRKVNLNTCDPAAVARKIAQLNREFEALCESMRRDPSLKPTPPRKEAEKLLRFHGLPPTGRGADELAASLFFDKLDAKREAYALGAEDPEDAYHTAALSDFLSPPEVEAVRLLNSVDTFLLSDVCELYLREHKKSTRPNFSKLEGDCRRVFKGLIGLVGDKGFTATTRDDVKRYRDSLLAKGSKTASVRRSLASLRAAFSAAIAERSLVIPNVCNKLSIRGENDDSESRSPFSPSELNTLDALCREADDFRRWILAIQADTGAAVGEVAGLRLEDLRLDGEVPHLVLCEYDGRTLKNDRNRPRSIPLFGLAKWAAGRIVETAAPGQVYAFPAYVRPDGTINSTAASATLNKWLLAHSLNHTTHELRHTFRDRMRNALVSEAIQLAVGGWGKLTHAGGYGEGHTLRVLREGLLPLFPESQAAA